MTIGYGRFFRGYLLLLAVRAWGMFALLLIYPDSWAVMGQVDQVVPRELWLGLWAAGSAVMVGVFTNAWCSKLVPLALIGSASVSAAFGLATAAIGNAWSAGLVWSCVALLDILVAREPLPWEREARR